jgi:ferritin-like metal-binding protein YciE
MGKNKTLEALIKSLESDLAETAGKVMLTEQLFTSSMDKKTIEKTCGELERLIKEVEEIMTKLKYAVQVFSGKHE